MAGEHLKINFDDLGLGTVLQRHKLIVPPNQRSYAWQEAHVKTLMQDLSTARREDDPTYFLGTIVLTRGKDEGEFEVADGQQRLATTTILISAIRDYLFQLGKKEKQAAREITRDYLLKYDYREEENLPKLTLNAVDRDFFSRVILPLPGDAARDDDFPATSSSHERLRDAKIIAAQHVENIVREIPREAANTLYDWVEFLRREAIVIVIIVPDHIDAFRMFETLNDRGRKASQVDILKNHLFRTAGTRVNEVEERWSSMVGVVESVGDDDLVLDCVRHSWIALEGPTTEARLAESVKDDVRSRQQAVDFATYLEDAAGDYTALLNPLHHSRWDGFDRETVGYLAVITRVLDVSQIRPLLLAVMSHFEPREVKESLRQFVSWSVRFLIAGGGGGGVLDRHYGTRAKEVSSGLITTASEIAERMSEIIRPNDVFRAAFGQHSVSKQKLARYYLRVLELQFTGDPYPTLGGVDDANLFNLEHILPAKPGEEWNIDPKLARAYHKRLGNMVLLSPNENVAIGNRGFPERVGTYGSSPLLLTQEVAARADWNLEEIDKRQADLADIAVQAWSL